MRAIASPMPDDPPVTSAALSTARTVNGVEAPALTGLTVGGGCAAKYSASRLEELLRGFVPAEAENLLVGLDPADDAAVYKLDDDRALVFTVDFFPPLVGDALFLTKPLGTGLVLAAKADAGEAIRWMTTLNAAAAEVLRPFAPSAVTDVTGFGLFGHAHEMAVRSGVRIRLDAQALPALTGALEAARDGVR